MERALGQAQPPLGSRVAVRAIHTRVLRIDQHHLTTRPLSGLDEHRLHRRDRTISSLTRHPGLRKERRSEVLDGDGAMRAHDAVRPLARTVPALPLHALAGSRSEALRFSVATRRPLPGWGPPARHSTLVTREPRRRALAVLRVHEIKRGVRGARERGNAPIDADRFARRRERHRFWSAHDEAGVPMPKRVAVHPHARRRRRQRTRPHHRNRHAPRQPQATLAREREATQGVVQARPRAPRALELPSPLPLRALRAEAPELLLLRDDAALTQPRVLSTPAGQLRITHPRARSMQQLDRLVPHPTAAVPLAHEQTLSRTSRTQAVRVPHGLPATLFIARRGTIDARRNHVRLSLPTPEGGGFPPHEVTKSSCRSESSPCENGRSVAVSTRPVRASP